MEQGHRSNLIRPAALWGLLKRTAAEWSEDKVPRLGAALAYYTIFAIVPLLVIIITMIGLFFGQEAAQSHILTQLAGLVGQQSAEAIRDMLQRAHQPSGGIVATAIAVVTLLLGASGLFGQLQDALNTIWGVEPRPGRGIWGLIQDRFLSFMAVLGTGFLLLVSLVLSAALSALGTWFSGLLPAPEVLLQTLNLLVSFGVITLLFAMMFKLLPDARIAWRNVWVGAGITALLFTLGKFLIGLYLGKSDIGSAYGAAGSLVIVLVWVYYSAQILLFGAEFTQVYANASGAAIVPTDQAVVVDGKKSGGGSPCAGLHRTSAVKGATTAAPASPAAHEPNRLGAIGITSRPLGRWDRWIGGTLLIWWGLQLLRHGEDLRSNDARRG
ncbi:MAG TPA: YihY/virulence factor BrkB family protein [Nitrospiraceae bacterium]|nr:YihY/virulence factor BrkB family protein [Nitrospiraceae bacterium]